jgi:hypothetical protein
MYEFDHYLGHNLIVVWIFQVWFIYDEELVLI